jgi:hypothetical protein
MVSTEPTVESMAEPLADPEGMVLLRSGVVLGRGFRIFFGGFLPFFVVATIAHAPLLAYSIYLATKTLSLVDLQRWALALQLAAIPCGQFAAAAILHGTLARLRGERASIASTRAIGLRRLLPAVAVAILFFLVVALGSLLLLVPGVLAMLTFYVAVPVAVVERPGVFASLRRSAQLTLGHRGDLFAVVIVQVCLFLAVHLIHFFGLRAAVESAVAAGRDPWVLIKADMFVGLGIDTAYAVLSGVLCGVVYSDLRAIKDGVGTDELAQVFA